MGKPAWTTPEFSWRSEAVRAAAAGLAGIVAGIPAALAPRCQVGCGSTMGVHGKGLVPQGKGKKLS